jgi:septal ring-binding cell division protein DamX
LGQDIIGSTIQEQNIRPKTALTIWPNPTTEELNFTIDSQEKDFYYEIKNLLGQTMQKGHTTGPTQKINLQQLTSGHYQIQFFSKNSIFEVQQFVKK